ncbi:MAG: GFA family protein [Candidatus Dadabacteria bacterium]|nr:GFA family protein [Candidatus Dadabacteria bacterium]
MLLEGSCHCGKVSFSVESHTPYPYMQCYCSICRKTAGGGGFAINIMAEAKSLKVEGMDNVKMYQAKVPKEDNPEELETSLARRHFCGSCGSALWIADPRWEEWIYPFASAINTTLPKPPERVHIMLEFAAPWCRVPQGEMESHFPGYPDEAIVDWHKRHGLHDGS